MILEIEVFKNDRLPATAGNAPPSSPSRMEGA